MSACGGGNSSSESADDNGVNNENASEPAPVLASRPIVTSDGTGISNFLECRINNMVLSNKTFAEMQGPTIISITYDVYIKTLLFDENGNPDNYSGFWRFESELFGNNRGYDHIVLKEGRNVFTLRHSIPNGTTLDSFNLAITNGYSGFCYQSGLIDINVI